MQRSSDRGSRRPAARRLRRCAETRCEAHLAHHRQAAEADAGDAGGGGCHGGAVGRGEKGGARQPSEKGRALTASLPCMRAACAPAVAPARGAPGAHDGGGDGGELRARLRAAAWSRRVRVSCSSRGPEAAQRGPLLGRKAAHRWCSPRGAAAPGRTRRGAAGGRRPARRPPGGRPRGEQRRAGGRRRERRRRQAPALHGGTRTVHARGAKARGSAGKRLRMLRPL